MFQLRSWYLSGLLTALSLCPKMGLGQVPITVPDTTSSPGDTLEIPIWASFSSENAVISAQFEISFDQSLLIPVAVSTEGMTLPQEAHWELQYNLADDLISVAMAGGDSLVTAGVLVFIRFAVDESASADQFSPVHFDTLIFNEGVPAAVPQDGSVTITITTVDIKTISAEADLPTEIALLQNYPNPFNPMSTIRYDLPTASNVSLIVYDLLGREVTKLVEGYMEPGYHQTMWDGRDTSGRAVPSGIYIARLRSATPGKPGLVTPPTAGQQALEYSQSIKMLLIK
jgi:hypothetical protein